jgi:hypothetical protein
MSEGRSGFSTVGLTDSRVMLIGGRDGGSSDRDIFDPATGTWSHAGIPSDCDHQIAILLPNGKVFAITHAGYAATAYIRLYDPRDNSWTLSSVNLSPGPLPDWIWVVSSLVTLLKNGNVLFSDFVQEGFPSTSYQRWLLYDCEADAITRAADSHIHHSSAIEVLLPDGQVLVAGGHIGMPPTPTTTSEVYDPGSNSWTLVGPMNEGRAMFVGILLPPPWDKVLVTAPTQTSDLYDVWSTNWTSTDNLNVGGRDHVAAMALLPSGKALMVGGASSTRDCELYDPDTDTWTLTDQTFMGRNHFSLAVLPTGKILAAGKYFDGDWPRYPEAEIYDPSDGNWESRSSLHYERAAHTVTPLPIVPTANCSTNVLVVGGENSTGAIKYCEFYNYSLEMVSITDSLENARTHHTAVLLADADVLVAGGKNGAELSSSELYDVSTQRWTTTGPLSNARYDHTATLLKNGRVLVTGGESALGELASCEVYGSGTWISTGDMIAARTCHSAVLLLDSTVLVIGGNTAGTAIASCEIWDGTSWSGTGPLATARYWHSAVLLQSGKVLVVGGTGDGSIPIASCEIYDPIAGTWSHEANLNYARYLHNSTLLYSGLILATGGQNASGYLSSCEVYDPALHQWKDDTSALLSSPRAYHSSVLIPDTMPFVLAIGGTDGSYLNSIEEYDVGLGYRSIWQSTITNHPSMIHISDSMHIDGTLFRGVSEADGGNYCHVSSNDHPIISYVRVGGGNWQGNGGGEILHMPLSSSWDTAHTDVHPEIGDFQGYYRLWSIVNGIPCKWYGPCTPSGVEESSQSTVHSPQSTVFPNPATSGSGVHFRFLLSTMDHGPSTLTIYDLVGRLVRSCPIDNSQLKIHGLSAGIYFYRVNCHSELVPACSRQRRAGRSESHTVKGKFTIVE